jgi:SOS response regulatory protein OraA/RecX
MVISNSRLSLRQGTVQAGISKSRYQVAMKQLDFKESIEEACKQVTEEMCRKVCRSFEFFLCLRTYGTPCINVDK